LLKAGAKITAADAAKLAKINLKVTWPVKAKVTNEIVYLRCLYEESAAIIAGGGNELKTLIKMATL
jgi:hypothetical protein